VIPSSDPPSPFRPATDGVTVSLRVTPKAGRNRIEGIVAEADGGQALKVAVTAAPEDGKANAAVIALLAKAWRVPRSSLSVIQGAGARRKVLHVAGDAGALLPRLAGLVERNALR
jgi:hypothetical protein